MAMPSLHMYDTFNDSYNSLCYSRKQFSHVITSQADCNMLDTQIIAMVSSNLKERYQSTFKTSTASLYMCMTLFDY